MDPVFITMAIGLIIRGTTALRVAQEAAERGEGIPQEAWDVLDADDTKASAALDSLLSE